MNSKNYQILRGTATLKAAQNYIAKHYANDDRVVIETQGSGEYVRFVVVAY